VQHAHQKGIIHRDLKPSNVLVTLHDGRPVVKVIDFGVAKALHQQLTDKTIYTRFAQVIGTPLYMSPEQAEMSGLDIDTRSDVYSLGVMLYELLTGTTPLDRERFANLAFDERVRIIRHEEPPKPSTRLRQSGDTLTSLAAQRRTDPAKLSKMFRGDLDWITMKALEKDRTRRYETASALAADVLRYLHNEPVEACPPSTTYRFKKFARRNRAALATVTAFVTLLLAGVVVSSGFAISEKSARQIADHLRQTADDEARNARQAQKEAEMEKRRALAAEAKAVVAEQSAHSALDRSEKSLYLNRIALAERNWEANNPRRAGEILDACPPKVRDWEWHYLKRLVHAEAMTLTGDNALYSPDGDFLATSDDQGVHLRDARTGNVLRSLKGGRPVPVLQGLAFSPDSHRLAAVCQDRAIWIWDLASGTPMLRVPVRLNEKTVTTPLDHPVGLAFSSDGKRIAMAGVESEKLNDLALRADNLMVWDAHSGKQVFKVSDTGRSLAFSPDGKWLAISRCAFAKIGAALQGPFTEGIRILNAETGVELVRFPPWERDGPHHYTYEDDCHLVFSRDGKWLASARGAEIKIWDAASAKEVRTLRGHARSVTRLSFCADGKRLASASRDETVRVWELERTDALVVYRGHVGAVVGVSFGPDVKFIASSGEDRTVRIWRATAEQGPHAIPGMQSHNASIALGPDGRYVSCYSEAREALVLVDASSGRVRSLRRCPKNADVSHASFVFSSDSQLLASALEKDVQVWDVATAQERAHFVGLSNFEHRGLAFSPDCAKIAFTGPENSVEVWDIRDHKRLTIYRGHQGPVTTIAFSPHSERVASGSTDQTVHVWEAANGRKFCQLKGTPAVTACVAFSPDGTRLLATTSDKAVCVWDLAKGEEVRTLRGHKASVWSMAFNATGTRLVTGGNDFVTRLWTWPECEEILSLPVAYAPVVVGFTVDGKKLATAGYGGATVWDAAPNPISDNPKK
jgi:WD40 repeat protein